MDGARRVSQWLVVLIGVGFIFGGGAKLNDPSPAVELFASWGVPGGWMIPTAGWVEVLLGLALLNRPTRPLASVGLSLWMLLWGTTQLLAGSWAAAASAVVLVLMGAYLTTWTMTRRQTDATGLPGMLRPHRPWLESPLDSRPKRFVAVLHGLARIVGLAFLIRWAVGGITYWLALPLLALISVEPRATASEARLERTLLHLVVLGLGVSGLWSFVGHTFMFETVSRSVGWTPSPFQKELAFYHFAVGVAGIACWWIRDHFWLAAVAIPSIFLYGAGWVHLVDFLEHGNTAPMNWGASVLFGNLILPTGLLVLVAIRTRRAARTRSNPTAHPT